MTTRSPAQPPVTSTERRRRQQIDLFDDVTPSTTPAWRDLPEETRDTLTSLMTRLILEHARIGTPAVRTEDGHDHWTRSCRTICSARRYFTCGNPRSENAPNTGPSNERAKSLISLRKQHYNGVTTGADRDARVRL